VSAVFFTSSSNLLLLCCFDVCILSWSVFIVIYVISPYSSDDGRDELSAAKNAVAKDVGRCAVHYAFQSNAFVLTLLSDNNKNNNNNIPTVPSMYPTINLSQNQFTLRVQPLRDEELEVGFTMCAPLSNSTSRIMVQLNKQYNKQSLGDVERRNASLLPAWLTGY
jgi:hypothetical protein